MLPTLASDELRRQAPEDDFEGIRGNIRLEALRVAAEGEQQPIFVGRGRTEQIRDATP